MPIDLIEETKARTPVLRRRTLGETFVGALVDNPVQRDVQKKNEQTGAMEPVLKPNGKPKQELVVTMVTMPGTTMHAGLGDDVDVPQPGDIVRTILKGGGYGAWIEANNELKPRRVGDVITLTSDYGITYDSVGNAGNKLTDQAAIDAVPRGRTVGIYGELTIRRADASEQTWVDRAELAYHDAKAIDLPTPEAQPGDVL